MHLVKDSIRTLAVHYRRVHVDNDIAIDVSAIVATTIDITTRETTVFVVSRTFTSTRQHWEDFLACAGGDSIPLQQMVSICINHIVGISSICIPSLSICQGRSVIITDFLLPTLGLYLQSTEVQLQLITVRIRSADEASLVGCVKVCGCHISIITATHQLIIYDYILREIESSLLSVNLHTTHITTTIDRTEIGRIWDIVVRITIRLFCKHNAGDKRHGYTFHVGFECFGVCQVNRAEL